MNYSVMMSSELKPGHEAFLPEAWPEPLSKILQHDPIFLNILIPDQTDRKTNLIPRSKL